MTAQLQAELQEKQETGKKKSSESERFRQIRVQKNSDSSALTVKRATVDDTFAIHGFHLGNVLWKERRKAQAYVHPSESGGIVFENSCSADAYVPYTISHIYGHRDRKTGARYVILSSEEDIGLEGKLEEGGMRYHVVEHLAASLHAAHITDAKIVIRNHPMSRDLCVPSNGPGIKEFVDFLSSVRVELPNTVSEVCAVQPNSYVSTDGNAVITVAPCDRLDVKICSAKHPDIVNLDEREMHIEDVYQEAEKHLEARPIARLQGKKGAKGRALGVLQYSYWLGARMLGYAGITGRNYIIASPIDSADDIVAKMHPMYQEGRNEHLAHTIYSDFLGELLALGSPNVRARFTLKDTNHITRIAALKKFARENTFY